MNLTPYEYIVCRQGLPSSESAPEVSGPRKSMLVVSEFIGCSPSLSGAIRVNPWNTEATAESLNEAISMSEREKQLRHEKHYRYVSTHDVAYWSRSFIQDLERACKDHFRKPCWGIGLGFGFRVVALDPNFAKLSFDSILMSYGRSKSRAIFLDYDAKEMLDHLESVLVSEAVVVKSGQFIVEVKPQGVSKGLVAEKILTSMKEKGQQADFVLCIGDDRSDEDMFENIADAMKRSIVAPKTPLFACTVGQKPSKAKFYLDDTYEVVSMLSALAEASEPDPTDLADDLATSVSSLDIGDEQIQFGNSIEGS
ncbi:hypothetical protein ACQ4PT_045346 [Festuca glaucescens]